MTSKFIFQGAEATLYSSGKQVTKNRSPKLYRYPALDEKLRIQRTRKEIKLLEKASQIINVPRIISTSDYQIILEKINGKNLASSLDKLPNKAAVAKQIGQSLAKLHDSNLIHGDLTTSNMIWSEKKSKTNTNNNKFKKQLSELSKLNLPSNQYAVFGSGPLAIRGIRASNDIDIIVKPELWNKLVKIYPQENEKLIKIGSIEVYKNWLPWFDDTIKLINDADIFSSIRFVKLKYVAAWKKEYNREKDKKDIKLIEQYQSTDKGKLYLIDFGLGFESQNIEDKAVDLHVLKEALEARHHKYATRLFKSILSGYKLSKNALQVIKRLEAVEKRGRYKQAY